MIIVIVSADSEWRSVIRVVQPTSLHASIHGAWFTWHHGSQPVIMLHGGWGKIAAAASAQYAIDRWRPTAIVNIGTCGGLEGRVRVGDVIVAERTVVSDMVVKIGEAADEEAVYTVTLPNAGRLRAGLPRPVVCGTIASGDRDVEPGDVRRLVERYDTLAADWESASIAFVAARNAVPCAIIRGVSDLVGEHAADAYDGREHIYHDGAAAVMRGLLADLPAILDAMSVIT